MKISKDFTRQVEILAQGLNGANLSKADYAEMYNIAEVTINRDLETLREYGIEIFSRKGKVTVTKKPSNNILVHLAADYLPLKLNSDVFIKQVKIFTKINRNDYFQYLTLIAKAVEEGLIIKIKYQRFYDNEVKNYKIKPIRLVTNELNWILNGIESRESIIKTFYLSRIKELKLTHKRYKKAEIPVKKEKLYKMTFIFKSEVEHEIWDKIWFEDFELSKDDKGNIILKTEQPITNKLSTWCISWWDTIKIEEPKELLENIKEMIYCFNNNQ